MLEFIPLASSSSGCAYLLKSEGHQPILLDAGLSFSELQKALWSEGVNVGDLAGCLISHGHLDHCKAVPKLMAAGIDCWASPEAWQHMGLAGHRSRIIRTDGIIGAWLIHPFKAVHDSDGTLGFCLDSVDGGRLLYLTDSAYCPYRFEGLTHICVEANFSEDLLKENAMAGRVNVEVAKRTLQTHASIERVIDMLRSNDLSKVEAIYLMHLSRANSDWRDFRDQVQRATGRAVYVCAERGGIEG